MAQSPPLSVEQFRGEGLPLRPMLINGNSGTSLERISDEVEYLNRGMHVQVQPVQWKRERAQGYSAFIACPNRIATQYQSLRGSVICLDADTGRMIRES